MGLLRKLIAPQPAAQSAPPATAAENLQQVIATAGQASLFAHTEFVKKVECSRCGAAKRLPSKTAYLYCDHCGSLVDYDFRLANLGTNAGYTNTVYRQIVAPVQAEIDRARAFRDKDRYRELTRGVYLDWLRQCPQAASPRVASDDDFCERMASYLAECMVVRDFDPGLATLDVQFNLAVRGLQRRPMPNGQPWLVSDGIWQVAALFKQQMEAAYRLLDDTGVLAMDPDEAPPGVPVRMEYSTFCQGWIPHLTPEQAEHLLAMFGLTSEYARAHITDVETRKCGGCGDELKVLPDAQAVVCESCGRKLDIAGGATPCRNCGAPLSFPVAVSRIECPYCQSETHRI
jgi:DNA-directed RNA polymerase subunit RPC12/RpoP